MFKINIPNVFIAQIENGYFNVGRNVNLKKVKPNYNTKKRYMVPLHTTSEPALRNKKMNSIHKERCSFYLCTARLSYSNPSYHLRAGNQPLFF